MFPLTRQIKEINVFSYYFSTISYLLSIYEYIGVQHQMLELLSNSKNKNKNQCQPLPKLTNVGAIE